jgi:hypothetical protein
VPVSKDLLPESLPLNPHTLSGYGCRTNKIIDFGFRRGEKSSDSQSSHEAFQRSIKSKKSSILCATSVIEKRILSELRKLHESIR